MKKALMYSVIALLSCVVGFAACYHFQVKTYQIAIDRSVGADSVTIVRALKLVRSENSEDAIVVLEQALQGHETHLEEYVQGKQPTDPALEAAIKVINGYRRVYPPHAQPDSLAK